VIIFIKKSSGDRYLSKKYAAKDTDFLPQKITARYNVTITVPPESP